MAFEDALKIAAALLASLGGASAIVLGFSNWLGKVWANRIMESDRAEQNRKLEEMRAGLSQKNQTLLEADRDKYNKELASLKADLAQKNQSILEADRAAYNKDLEKLRAQLAQENQSLLEAERSNYNRDLEELRATLARANEELSAENKARRDYEYEARKRLYKECEPLLFRFAEASENALHRIFSLARTARMGDLGPKKPNWLQWPGYYMASTIYNLLAPLVIFRLLQNKLTLVDLTVDRRISNQYLIAKWIYISFTEDFVLAQSARKIAYDPFIKGWEEKRNSVPDKYWRQGLTLGRLDVAIEGMTKRMPDGIERCMSFGEFEIAFNDDLQNKDGLQFGALADIFTYFHPAQRPILWRILVLQAHLYAKLMELFIQHGTTGFFTCSSEDFFSTDMQHLDWRQHFEHHDGAVILEPMEVAKDYLHVRLPDFFLNQQPAKNCACMVG